MGSEKRRRQKERRAAKRAEARQRLRRARWRALLRLWLILTGLSLAVAFALQLAAD